MIFNDWHDVEKKKPQKFDLVTILFEGGICKPGWWTGYEWDGFKLPKNTAISWKKRGNERRRER